MVHEILAVEADVIDLDIPFLLARDVLGRMKAQIDFSARTMQMERQISTDLIFPNSGHVLFEWIFEPKIVPIVGEQSHLNLIYSNSCAEETQMNQQQVRKLHIQFGHADSAALIRILRQAKKPYDARMIQTVVQSCRCGRSSGPGQEPAIGRNISMFPGQVVFADTFFPMLSEPQRWPAVVFVCAHTRFVCARFLSSQRPEAYINVLSCNWATLMGFPRILICDNATTFAANIGMQRLISTI